MPAQRRASDRGRLVAVTSAFVPPRPATEPEPLAAVPDDAS